MHLCRQGAYTGPRAAHRPRWATISFSGSATTGVPFLDTCMTGSGDTAAVYVSEDATAEVTLLGSTKCGQVNGRTVDLATASPDFSTTGTPNMVNLTMLYASPVELIAFGTVASAGFVTLHIQAASVSATSVTLSAKIQVTAPPTLPLAAAADRTVAIVANNFGGTVAARASSCPAGACLACVALPCLPEH